jgi:hypothetical protein
MEEMMHSPIQTYVVIGPSRSSSTAFARVLWNNPEIRYYAHEPYEATYHDLLDTQHALTAMADPVDLIDVTGSKSGEKMLVKEMSYQLDGNLEQLLARTAHPVVFLIRDPRLTISSRRKIKEAQRRLDFPLVETGWQDLVRQVEYCREYGVEYLIIDSFDFRTAPELVFRRLYSVWGLEFDTAHLTWTPQPGMALSDYRKDDTNYYKWYTRVLKSKYLESPIENPGALEDFPEADGLRAHVEWAIAQYRQLREDQSFIGISTEVG